MSINDRLKGLVFRSVHKLIYCCWVDPLQQRIPDLSALKPGWRRRALLGSALWAVNLGRLAITDFRVHVRRLRGAQWSVVYIGGGFSFEELRHSLFPTPPEVEDLSRVFLWQVPALAKQFADQGELVVCELNQIISWRPRGAYVFTVPRSIKQILDIARPVEDILAGMNQNMRRNLHRMKAQGFSYVFTREEADFDLFYQKMYCPYIYKRHSARATLDGYGAACYQFRQGGLILVKLDQAPICGMLCRVLGGSCEAAHMGVLEGHFDYVSQGANVALWWFMMDWARQKGLRYFDFGTSRAQMNNGTFNFKRQWGTQVARHHDVHTKWVFYSEELPFHLRSYLNEQGFISEVAGLHYQVVLLDSAEELDETELARKRREASRFGLAGVLVVSPESDGKESPNLCKSVLSRAT